MRSSRITALVAGVAAAALLISAAPASALAPARMMVEANHPAIRSVQVQAQSDSPSEPQTETQPQSQAQSAPSSLQPGESMVGGDTITSPSGAYALSLHSDGNVVLTETANQTALWSTNTQGRPGSTLIMQHDGNLVLYAPPIRPYHARWHARTYNWPGAFMTVTDDGTVNVVHPDGRTLWTAGTSIPQTEFVDEKHVVYQRGSQRVWLIEADGSIRDNYLVSGRATSPALGSAAVYSKSEVAWSYGGGVTMQNMVRFTHGYNGGRIGFHAIPTNWAGEPIQSLDELGTPLSAGCVRMRDDKALELYEWAPIGTPVVVLGD